MTLSSRHRIRNSSPGGLRPSTLPLGHGGSPQYWLSHVDGEETLFVSFTPPRPGTKPLTLARKAAGLTATLGPPPSTSKESDTIYGPYACFIYLKLFSSVLNVMPSDSKFSYSCKKIEFCDFRVMFDPKSLNNNGPATCLRQYKVHNMSVSYVTHGSKCVKN